LKVKEGFVNAGDVNLHYLRWGNGSRTILALHGVSSIAHAWDIVGEELASRYRFIAMDQRGHGDSSKPEEGYTVDDYSNDILAFTDRLSIRKLILLGHSMGGRNAIVFAAKHPKRVSKLIVEDFGYGIPKGVYKVINTRVLNNPEEFMSEDQAFQHLKARSKFYRDDATWNRISNAFLKTKKGIRWKYDRNAITESLNHLYIDLTPYLKAIQCPTLFIRGEKSEIFSKEAALETLEFNENFQLEEVSNSTHFIQDENPEELIEKIRTFLN
jgi:esterase